MYKCIYLNFFGLDIKFDWYSTVMLFLGQVTIIFMKIKECEKS
jgi:hypothetical protein